MKRVEKFSFNYSYLPVSVFGSRTKSVEKSVVAIGVAESTESDMYRVIAVVVRLRLINGTVLETSTSGPLAKMFLRIKSQYYNRDINLFDRFLTLLSF
jgi:hypothetical protein